ncbi:hypothetical protein COM13_17450 [Bacillus pseudomycoides]|nr:hypothetical protein COO07_27965 [Bacillus pseudomycoides]PEK78364.1 hypothetical protein CN597_16705 [Bacillus pseudomycoides]PEN01044.1 hypothetical protein CN640_29025 [Bacillus pseudomycoides]PGB88069.1 hypothetical protein COM13_17450 [Bacillus pseudomycoides]PHE56200.1 hypothetical protein COF52_11570 [Bacillus pseudomycoides]
MNSPFRIFLIGNDVCLQTPCKKYNTFHVHAYYEGERLLYEIIKGVVNKVTQGVFKCIKLLNFLEFAK